MSNSTRPSGYDERLVVPLEASRRGAHRARINPLMSVLPVLAVVVVVVAVIGVAYTLFVKGTNTADDNPTGTVPATSAPAAPNPTGTTSAPAAGSSSSKPATSASASSSSAAPVDKDVALTVYNGSTPAVNGLGAKAQTALEAAGWTKAKLVKGTAPVQLTTTRVYYAKESQKPTAEAIAKSLGVGSAKLSTSIATSGIVVVVGNDYNS
jgi:LytR cell envelope-related transcriptional attenuator